MIIQDHKNVMLPVTFVVAYTGCGSSELLVLDWSLEVNCIVYLLIISLSAVLTYFTVFYLEFLIFFTMLFINFTIRQNNLKGMNKFCLKVHQELIYFCIYHNNGTLAYLILAFICGNLGDRELVMLNLWKRVIFPWKLLQKPIKILLGKHALFCLSLQKVIQYKMLIIIS